MSWPEIYLNLSKILKENGINKAVSVASFESPSSISETSFAISINSISSGSYINSTYSSTLETNFTIFIAKKVIPSDQVNSYNEHIYFIENLIKKIENFDSWVSVVGFKIIKFEGFESFIEKNGALYVSKLRFKVLYSY